MLILVEEPLDNTVGGQKVICTVVEAKGDLELVVKQIRGEYGVNEPSLYPLHERAQELAEEFERFEIRHVPRDENWEADQLVEKAFGN